MTKALLRKEALAARSNLPGDDCSERSRRICDRLLSSNEYQNASTVLLYKAYNNEVDTDPIFERAIRDGKKVYYPVSDIVDGHPTLTFYEITDASQLIPGYRGIMEPDVTKGLRCLEGSADICITPGVAFDRKCHRVGYGKAFYDRYLRMNTPKTVVGLAYDIQIVDEFAVEDTDISVDAVMTESKTYYA